MFIFIRLSKTDQNGGNKASHVVVKENGEAIDLLYEPKASNCYVVEFSPDKHSKQVQSKSPENESEYFIDNEEKRYLWIDQLKTSHAQRAVETFARELSRVGLTESEWLRLLDK